MRECTGCAACANACPQRCIELREDPYGETHPSIEANKCVDCGLCVKVCPNNREPDFRWPEECFATWEENVEDRLTSASGGVAAAMASYTVARGGVVFGTVYDKDLTPVTTSVEDESELERLKGSKYVQSVVGPETYRSVKGFLESGREVLYVGTPCQVAGLKGFLRREYENLTTVDLICHGVSPTKYFKEEVDYLVRRHHAERVTNVRFRGNDGNDFRLTLWRGAEKIYSGSTLDNYYFGGFMGGVSLRENCYSCRYARPERVADITIGDFIGLGKEEPFGYDAKNVSFVSLNTDRGKTFYQSVLEKSKGLRSVKRHYEERLRYKPSLVVPFRRSRKNGVFRRLYRILGYRKSIVLTLWPGNTVYRLKLLLRKKTKK